MRVVLEQQLVLLQLHQLLRHLLTLFLLQLIVGRLRLLGLLQLLQILVLVQLQLPLIL